MRTCPACEQGPMSEEEFQEAMDKMNGDPRPPRAGEDDLTAVWMHGYHKRDDELKALRSEVERLKSGIEYERSAYRGACVEIEFLHEQLALIQKCCGDTEGMARSIKDHWGLPSRRIAEIISAWLLEGK